MKFVKNKNLKTKKIPHFSPLTCYDVIEEPDLPDDPDLPVDDDLHRRAVFLFHVHALRHRRDGEDSVRIIAVPDGDLALTTDAVDRGAAAAGDVCVGGVVVVRVVVVRVVVAVAVAVVRAVARVIF